MITEKWMYKGHEIVSTWQSASKFDGLSPVTQVSCVCFTPEGKVLVVRETDHWIIPGGKPELGESYEDTLHREVTEEACIDVEHLAPLGYTEVIFPNNPNKREGDHFYQLRYTGTVKKVNPMKVDPATGAIFDRKFIRPEEFTEYVKWGVTGEAMFAAAIELRKN